MTTISQLKRFSWLARKAKYIDYELSNGLYTIKSFERGFYNRNDITRVEFKDGVKIIISTKEEVFLFIWSVDFYVDDILVYSNGKWIHNVPKEMKDLFNNHINVIKGLNKQMKKDKVKKIYYAKYKQEKQWREWEEKQRRIDQLKNERQKLIDKFKEKTE